MIPFDSLVLLDTNVVVHLARDKRLGRRINEDYQLSERRVARKRAWGDAKVENLKDIVRGLTVVDIRPQKSLTATPRSMPTPRVRVERWEITTFGSLPRLRRQAPTS